MRLRVLIVALIAAGVLIPAALVLTQQRAAAANMVLSILNGTADVARGVGDFARVADGRALTGEYLISANVASLLAEPQTCTLR